MCLGRKFLGILNEGEEGVLVSFLFDAFLHFQKVLKVVLDNLQIGKSVASTELSFPREGGHAAMNPAISCSNPGS